MKIENRALVRMSGAVAASALLMSAMAGPAAANNGNGNGNNNPNDVNWANIVGIEQPGNNVGLTGTTLPPTTCDTTKGCVKGAGQPWTTLGGQAQVDLSNGQLQFDVEGLVLAGGNSIGTPDNVTQVLGALVCITTVGTVTKAVVTNTALVPLSPSGDAQFSGTIVVDGTCNPSNVAFLIRSGNTQNWIANGSVRTSGKGK
jgi:hypothetical protein